MDELDETHLGLLAAASETAGVVDQDLVDRHPDEVQWLATAGYLRYRWSLERWVLTDAGWSATGED